MDHPATNENPRQAESVQIAKMPHRRSHLSRWLGQTKTNDNIYYSRGGAIFRGIFFSSYGVHVCRIMGHMRIAWRNQCIAGMVNHSLGLNGYPLSSIDVRFFQYVDKSRKNKSKEHSKNLSGSNHKDFRALTIAGCNKVVYNGFITIAI